jgi:hypothetical protein
MEWRSQKRMRCRRERWSRTLLGCLLLAGMVAASGAMRAQEAGAEKPSQDDVRAAYLYDFGQFVRWPEGAGRGPLLGCVAGKDPFGQTMGKLAAGKQINGRTLEARNLDRPEAAGDCSILFVGTPERGHADAYLAATAAKPVLTVGEGPDSLTRGGMIEFVVVEDRVRFSVNLDAANRCSVGLSSELLKVAVTVTDKPGTGGSPK